jgi:hypothetical protein
MRPSGEHGCPNLQITVRFRTPGTQLRRAAGRKSHSSSVLSRLPRYLKGQVVVNRHLARSLHKDQRAKLLK